MLIKSRASRDHPCSLIRVSVSEMSQEGRCGVNGINTYVINYIDTIIVGT